MSVKGNRKRRLVEIYTCVQERSDSQPEVGENERIFYSDKQET